MVDAPTETLTAEAVTTCDLPSMRREDLEREVVRLRKASKSYCDDAKKMRRRANAATAALRELVADLETNLPKGEIE